MNPPPGVMLYFDDIEPILTIISAEQKGILFDSIIQYARHGTVPEIQDQLLSMAWQIIKPKLDRDHINYENKSIKSEYSVFIREIKKKAELKIIDSLTGDKLSRLEFDEWVELSEAGKLKTSEVIERYRTIKGDNGSYRMISF